MKDQKYYVEKLNQVYKKHYYDNGVCPFFKECSQNMEDAKIKCDYATRVGKDYGKEGIPKVVVLGKESVSQHKEHEEPTLSLNEASNEHYRKTLYTLALILEGKEPTGYACADLKPFEKLLEKFCLTNYFKCAFSDNKEKVYDLDHSKAMKQNCYKILLDELKTLKPDLLVVQGKFTTKDFWNSLDQNFEKGNRIYGNKTEKDDTISLYQHKIDEKPFFVLYSYHPSAYGLWNETEYDLKEAIKIFREKHGSKAE